MLFKPGDYKFNVLSENVHYLFLFKSPRNASKIIQLAKQVSPYDNKFIFQSYKNATKEEFSYLLFDFHKSTPEENSIKVKNISKPRNNDCTSRPKSEIMNSW